MPIAAPYQMTVLKASHQMSCRPAQRTGDSRCNSTGPRPVATRPQRGERPELRGQAAAQLVGFKAHLR
eukprot:scaffold11521_cov68-Phaeocystis_antarctica.AAC.11